MSVVGIDLGTTNTVVACVRDGRVHVLADDKGNRLLPSVVSFHPNGDVLVGPLARERRLVDARNTIASIKRLIGRPWDSDEMRLARSRFPFELREGPGQGALVIARGEAYTLPEISAFVLKRCRQIAEAALGETVDKAVITVPAHFNELQRASTKVAGRVAGLEVLRILNEPTAAALAYGFGSERSERVAVYDFGGGTFDCSLLDLTGSLFEVLATAGDTFLGGDDVDTAIADVMCNAFLAQHRYDPRTDPQAFERLRAAAEQLKKDLSVNMQAQVDLPEVAYGVGGKRLGFTFGLTQADLDALASPLVDRTLQVTQDSLNIAHLSPSSFDSVVLVGGSTRMPIVKRRVEAFFGIPVIDRVNPDEVVAVGAAVQAAALVDQTRKRGIPLAPRPGIIGPPQQVQEEEGATTSQPSPISTRGMGVKAPPPVPPPAIKTLRPAAGGTAPMAAVPPPRPPADTTDDHSIGSGHTMPANLGGPPSMTNILDAFPFGNTTASNPVARSDQTLSSMGAKAPEPTLPSAQAAPPPEKAGASSPPKAWGPMKGMLRPLETEDISRIVPDAHPAALRARTMPSTPPVGPLGARRPTGDVGPLETEDISMIVPEAHPAGMYPRVSPSAAPPGSAFGRPSDVAPLNTEDISMIVPERSNPGFRGPSNLPAARGPGAPAPFAFPPFPQAPQFNQPQGAPAPFAPPPFASPHTGGQAPGGPTGGAFAPSPFQLPSFDAPAIAPPPPPFGFPQQGFQQAFPPLPPAQPGDFSPPPGWQNAAAPVLVDVTPRALVVEVVGGYCDVVIPRNAKIPCEHTRVFATGRDHQTLVHVRVAQGEEQKFEGNQYLGELELTDLRPAARGEVTLSVTFELDANGSLLVRAIDATTGRQAQANMKLIAVAQSEEAIEEMIERSRSVSVTG